VTYDNAKFDNAKCLLLQSTGFEQGNKLG